jgi:putative membrane protein
MRAGRLARWPFAGGLAVLGAAWLGPLPELARHAFAAHMTLHMAVVAVAAPLLAAGLAGSRFDPVGALAPGGRAVRVSPPARLAAVVLSPVVASAVEFVVVWAWHAPVLHHAARASTIGLLVEQASFLGVGLLVWLAAFGGGAGQRRQRAPAGIGGLLLTSMHMTLLGVLLALATRPLYPHGGASPWGLTALEDQHLGGVLMLLFGGVAYLAGALVLLHGLLHERRGAVARG